MSKKKRPPIWQRLVNYAGATRLWKRAGRPERTDEEIQEIKYKHCWHCPARMFVPTEDGKDGCMKCGCAPARIPLFNVQVGGLTQALRYATYGCPMGYFQPKVVPEET